MTTPEQSVTERIERPAQPPVSAEPAPKLTFEAKNVSIWYGEKRAIENVSLDIASNAVTAIIGPSGCGKSTFLRALNRMHELVPKTRMDGTVLLHGEDLYSKTVDPAIVRRRVGMIFQKSNPFPTMTIGENVVVGLPKRSLARLTASCFGVASDFTSGRSTIFGLSSSSSEMRWSRSPFASCVVVTSFTIPTPGVNQRSIVIRFGDVCSP